jgi:DNA-binding transcriptional LysR family regulator
MNAFDWLKLDAWSLTVLVTVVEEGSVTAAATRLGVTQSAVSHTIERLRQITNDALFVKSGRGIVATAHANALAQRSRAILRELEQFGHGSQWQPATWTATITIAANDFQRDLLLPAVAAKLRVEAPNASLRVIASGVPTLEMLRDERCQLVITPRPPDGSDIVQKRLFEDDYRVFFDASQRSAPATRAEYLSSEHVTVVYEPKRALDIDQWMHTRNIHRNFRIMVPGFAGIAPFIRGTELLATVPGRLRTHLLSGLADAEVPIKCPRMPMYLVWHRRYQDDAPYRWLRGMVEGVARAVVAAPATRVSRATPVRGELVEP